MNIRCLVAVGLILIPLKSFSQVEYESKFPHWKTFMIEVNFSPFADDGVISFDNLQSKYWIDESKAFRLGLEIDRNRNKTKANDYPSGEENKSTMDEQSLLIGIKPGIEFRILTNSKISPYWGVEFLFRNQSAKAEYTDYRSQYNGALDDYVYEASSTNVDGAWREVTSSYLTFNGGYYYSTSMRFDKNRAFSALGANLLFGADFYPIKNLYVGLEFGLGYQMTKYKQVTIDISTETEKVTAPSGVSREFGFYYNKAMRLGIWF